MPEINHEAILTAAAGVAAAGRKAATAREQLAAPPPVDSESHPVPPEVSEHATPAAGAPGGAG